MATIPSANPPIRFGEFPSFAPFYTPTEMLLLGVFAGAKFNRINAQKTIPPEVFIDVPWNKYVKEPDMAENYFNVIAVERDREIGIIEKRYHPHGWFQWYCGFYHGRRSIVDAARIRQWEKELKNISHYIRNGVYAGEGNRWTDNAAFTVYKQHLLQFGWDPTQDPLTYVIPELP